MIEHDTTVTQQGVDFVEVPGVVRDADVFGHANAADLVIGALVIGVVANLDTDLVS